MASDNPDYLHLASNKFFITCKTCGVRESFYSELSVGYFRLRHAGHELVEERSRPKAEKAFEGGAGLEAGEPAQGEQPEAEEAQGEAAPADGNTVVVDQVVVEARASREDGAPVVQVRGLGRDGKDSFVRLFKLEEAARMREFLGSGRYEPEGESVAYVWDPLEVRFEWNREGGAAPSELGGVQPPAEVAPAADSVAASMESMVEEKPPPPEAEPEAAQEGAPEPPEASEAVPEVAPERPVEQPAEPEAPRPRASPPPRKQRRRRPKARPAEPKQQPKVVQPPPAPAPAPGPEPEKEEALLLAKSSYLQEGEEIKREAVRISRMLKAFRWNVEPVYTIGVMVDDNMSIETNKAEISGTLLRQIEGAGYRLSAVTVASGKPTAWFKRRAPPEPLIPAGPEGAQRLKVKVDELSKRLRNEKRRAEERNALWEESLRKLMKAVRSEETRWDSMKPEDEAQPDTDVTS